jgi:hypothetical protein
VVGLPEAQCLSNKNMYNNVVTSDGDTNDFLINIGLHQGLATLIFLLW